MSRALVRLACAGLLVLTGCAGKPLKPPAEPPPWASAGPCANSLVELPSTALAPDKRALWHGDFRTAAACLQRSGVAQPVILLALDEGSAQQELDLFLHIGQDYLLCAAVSLLDAARNPVRSHSFGDFTPRGSHFSLRLFPQPDRAPAAYVLIQIDREACGSDLDRISGQRVQSVWVAGGYAGAIADGIETQQRISIRDTGQLSLHRVVEKPVSASPGRR